jgi:hypothetical protein
VKHLLAQRRTRSAPAAIFAACAAVFFSTGLFSARALDLPPALTLDVPIAANLATPAWLGHPATPTDTLATLDLPITPPDPGAALLVTVYFQETDNGFLRINWKNDQGAVALADNFYENIGMANQRSLLIPPSSLGADGTLIFQGSATTLGIQRIKLEWLESRQDLISPATSAMLVTSSTGTTVPADSVNGQAAAPQAGAWDGDVVTVPISTDPVRIEQGVEFSVDLDKVPTSARVALKETGLSLSQHLVVWINDARAGTITPTVPGLNDSGFFTDTSSKTTYVGWRDGSFYVPVTLLKEGVNTIVFSSEDELPAAGAATDADATTPLALKGVALQLDYQAPPEPPAVELPVLHLSGTATPLPLDDSSPSTDYGPSTISP